MEMENEKGTYGLRRREGEVEEEVEGYKEGDEKYEREREAERERERERKREREKERYIYRDRDRENVGKLLEIMQLSEINLSVMLGLCRVFPFGSFTLTSRPVCRYNIHWFPIH